VGYLLLKKGGKGQAVQEMGPGEKKGTGTGRETILESPPQSNFFTILKKMVK